MVSTLVNGRNMNWALLNKTKWNNPMENIKENIRKRNLKHFIWDQPIIYWNLPSEQEWPETYFGGHFNGIGTFRDEYAI